MMKKSLFNLYMYFLIPYKLKELQNHISPYSFLFILLATLDKKMNVHWTLSICGHLY